MGIVYEAEDLELGRPVALKFLPESPSEDAAAIERFKREARAAASLNHPNICTIYDIGHHEGRTFIVMECLVGESLERRLRNGPVDVRHAIEFTIQITSALDLAHAKALIHRDIKPANFFLTTSGDAKILDFGLAKQVISDPAEFNKALTADQNLTRPGSAIGTVAYMAPEQARGEEIDPRADLFCLGAVLYEMITGRQAFMGATTALIHDAILNRHPAPCSQLNPAIPPELERITGKCMEKDPAMRYQSARDLQIDLKRLLAAMQSGGSTAAYSVGTAAGPGWRRWLPWIVAIALGAALAVLYFNRPAAPAARTFPFQIVPPEGTMAFAGIASPDKKTVAFTRISKENKYSIWLRPMDTLAMRELPGTDAAHNPFWSPDNRTLAFFADHKLKRISIDGGSPQILCDGEGGGGGIWTRQGEIIFESSGSIWRIAASASGGVANQWLKPDTGAGEASLHVAGLLPDGRVLVQAGSRDKRRLNAISLDFKGGGGLGANGLAEAGSDPWFADGYLLSVEDSNLVARPLDPAKMQFTGEPQRLAEQVEIFSLSGTGALVWRSLPQVIGRLSWLAERGQVLGAVGTPAAFDRPAMSYDNKRVAVGVLQSGKRDLWTVDLGREALSQLTWTGNIRFEPVWSHSGSKIFFTMGIDLYSVDSQGGSPAAVLKNPRTKKPMDTTPDDRYLIYQEHDGKVKWHIWAVDLQHPDDKPFPVTWSEFNEGEAKVSPDGHWVAYASEESGIMQTYIKPFPPVEKRWQVSVNGGMAPRWRADGRQLYFLYRDRHVMAVDLKLGSAVEVSKPRELFMARGLTNHSYDPSTDGKRFVMVLQDSEAAMPLNVISNWRDLLPQR